MSYHENVRLMCARNGIKNPIGEEDLTVLAVSFLVDGNWVRVDGTEMNRAGRLFFQDFVSRYPGEEATVLKGDWSSECGSTLNAQISARNHFAENWLDAEEKGRAMLIAFRKATHITVHWKIIKPLNLMNT